MAIAERSLPEQPVPDGTLERWARLPTGLVARSASAIGRWFAGSSGGAPRGYPREGFPEIELHEIVAGRRERFDGLL